MSYYKANLEVLQYVPLFGRWTLAFTGDLGYGQGLGSAKCYAATATTAAYCVDPTLPPYELFYGGGPDSVRGFQESRLGPKDQYGNPYGGNLNVLARSELIIPMPAKIASSARVSLFVDVGNVFSVGKGPTFYAPPGQPPPYPPNQCGYSCGNVSQAELNDPTALTRESYRLLLQRAEGIRRRRGAVAGAAGPVPVQSGRPAECATRDRRGNVGRSDRALPVLGRPGFLEPHCGTVILGPAVFRYDPVPLVRSGRIDLRPGVVARMCFWVARRAFPLNLGFAHKRSIVKGVVRSLILGSAATLVLAAAPAYAELKIGYVNYSQLLQESPDAKTIADALRNEFLPRQRELQTLQQTLKSREDKLTKDGATMTDDQRAREDKAIRDGERELQRKQSEAQDDFNTRRNEELSTLQKSLIEQVQTYAKSQSFDLILADGVIWAAPVVDITPQVLSVLQARGGSKAAAPAATPKPAGK